MDDTELVRRAQHGDTVAFEQLVRRHQRYVFNVAYRVLNDYAEAEDMTQEAFVRAWRGLPGFRGQARFTTWLYRIVHNLCLNRLPGLRRELLQTESLEESVPTPDPSQAELVEIREQMAFLHAQLDQLPGAVPSPAAPVEDHDRRLLGQKRAQINRASILRLQSNIGHPVSH